MTLREDRIAQLGGLKDQAESSQVVIWDPCR